MIPDFVRRFLERRRFPTLMLLGGLLFIINLLVPDPIPFFDEALLLIATVAIGSLRGRKKDEDEDEKKTPDDRHPGS